MVFTTADVDLLGQIGADLDETFEITNISL